LAQIAAVLATNAQNSANSYTDGQISSVNSVLNAATGNISALTTDIANLSTDLQLTIQELNSLNADLTAAQAQCVNIYDGSQNPGTAYATQVMTSDVLPTPLVASANNEQTGYSAWQAFDQATGTRWSTVSTTAMPCWIEIDLGASASQIINKFRYYGVSGSSPKSWQLQGSLNGSAWTTLLDNSGVDVADPGYAWTPYFTCVNSTVYRYYRLYINATWGASNQGCSLYEIQLIAASAVPTLYSIANSLNITTQLTAYTTVVGTLQSALAAWTGLTYPVAITTNQRAALISNLTAVSSAENILISAIAAAEAVNAEVAANSNTSSVVDALTSGVIATAQGDISSLSTDLAQLSSTSYITLATYTAYLADYNKAYAQTSATPTTLYTIASGLTGLSTQITAFTTAVGALNTALSPFSAATFPTAITTLQAGAISTALTNVATTENLLIAAIANAEATAQAGAVQSNLNTVSGNLSTAQGNITTLNNEVGNLSSITQMTLAESINLTNEYNAALAQTVNAGTTLYTTANGFTGNANLTTDQKTAIATLLSNYTTAVSNLGSGLSVWINQATYPIAITSGQRSTLSGLIAAVSATESALVSGIATAEAQAAQAAAISSANGYTAGQIGTINSTISGINGTLSTLATENSNLSSLTEMSLAQAQGLLSTLNQLQSQSTSLVSQATSLSITTQLTTYQNALVALANGLGPWTGCSCAAPSMLYATQVMTSNALPTPNLVTDSSEASGYGGWRAFNQDGGTTQWKSTGAAPCWLEFNFGSANKQAINQFAYMGVNGYSPKTFTIQASNDGTTWTTLYTGTNVADPGNAWTAYIPFTNTTAYQYYQINVTVGYSGSYVAIAELQLVVALVYPLAITPTQQANITSLINAVQSAESVLTLQIISVEQTNAIGSAQTYTNGQISTVSGQITTVSGNLSTLTGNVNALSSVTSLTLAESNTLALSLSQLQANSTGLEASASGLSVSTAAYAAALAALVTGLGPWINQSSYPLTINSTQRSNIITLLNTATAAETALVNAISTAEAAAASATVQSNLNTVVNGVIATATGNISTLTTDLGQLSSTSYLTLGNYNSYLADYNKALAQTVNSGTTLYTIANGLGITTQLTNFVNAVTGNAPSLQAALSPFSSATFPAAITTIQTTALQTALTNVASTENLLIAQIAAVQATNAQSAAISSANSNTASQISSVNSAISSANSAIGSLNTDFNNLSNATYLTAAEAQSLLSDLQQAQAQTSNLVADGSQNTSTTNVSPVPVVSNSVLASTNWTTLANPPWTAVIDFGSGNATVINKFCYYGFTGLSPRRWSFQGSNDGSTWTTLLDNTGTDVTDPSNDYTPFFTFINSTAYRYYQLNITASYSSNAVAFAQFILIAAITGPTLYSIASGLGITIQLTAYTQAVANLASGLTSWVNE
jgi:hypothetical protein